MKRRVDMNEISDGRLYALTDTVNCDSGDCAGCSHCCHATADTIILDPYDVFMLSRGTGKDGVVLLSEGLLELNVVDGIVLPNLSIKNEKKGCGFLDEQGRCSVHAYRPGLCRLFPLGRIYDEEGFKYFLQIHECKKQTLGAVKVFKWLGISNIKEYERFVFDWHLLITGLQDMALSGKHQKEVQEMATDIIKGFFFTPYVGDYFFGQYEERKAEFMEKYSGVLERGENK